MKSELKDAMKSAMRDKDKVKLTTIRSILSAIQYEEMQKNSEDLPQPDVLAVLNRELKKRREEMEFAEKSGRAELIDDLEKEISVIQDFLPKQLDQSELRSIVEKLKSANPDLQLGQVMKMLGESYAGQYDGKVASQIAREVIG